MAARANLEQLPEDQLWEKLEKGYYTPAAVCESLGYCRQTLSMRRKDDPQFARRMDQALARGRMKVTDEMLELARKANQWQAFSRILEVVHDVLHPLDEEKRQSLRRTTDATVAGASEADRAVWKQMNAAIPGRILPAAPAIVEEPKADDGGDEPSEATT